MEVSKADQYPVLHNFSMYSYRKDWIKLKNVRRKDWGTTEV